MSEDDEVNVFTIGPASDSHTRMIAENNDCPEQFIDKVVEIGDGNPGATVAATEAAKHLVEEEGEDKAGRFLGALLIHRELASAPYVWVAYKDHCGEDAEQFIEEINHGSVNCESGGPERCRHCRYYEQQFGGR